MTPSISIATSPASCPIILTCRTCMVYPSFLFYSRGIGFGQDVPTHCSSCSGPVISGPISGALVSSNDWKNRAG